MQIDSLSLSNFRGLLNSTLDFTPGFNLIVGINGAGKTSVLDALKIVLAKAAPQFVDRHLVFPGVGMQVDDITLGRGASAISCKLSRNGQSFDLEIAEQREQTQDALKEDRFGGRGTRDVPVPPGGWRTRRPLAGDLRLDGTLRGQSSEGTQGTTGLVPPPDPIVQKAGPKPLVLYLSVRRAIVSHAVPKGSNRHPAYQRAFVEDRGLASKQLADWWRGRQALADEELESRAAKQLAAVKEALRLLLPHLGDWAADGDELKVTKVFDVERIDGTGSALLEPEHRRIPLRMLSDGERSLAAIATDIAQRLVQLNEALDNPLTEGTGVVLIDELDLHLHPQWQRTVIEGLRAAFPRLQFICTTHSLFLIQSQRMGTLIRLDHIGDEEASAENFHHKSIEDLAEEVQEVAIPQRSQRHVELMQAASEYYRELREAEGKADASVDELRKKYEALSLRYSDDPLVAASLDFKWETYLLLSDKHAASK